MAAVFLAVAVQLDTILCAPGALAPQHGPFSAAVDSPPFPTRVSDLPASHLPSNLANCCHPAHVP
jgi:hypothetical protein